MTSSLSPLPLTSVSMRSTLELFSLLRVRNFLMQAQADGSSFQQHIKR